MTQIIQIHFKVVYTKITRTYYVKGNITIEEFIQEIKRKIGDDREIIIENFELVPLSEEVICAEDGPALEPSNNLVSTICNDDYTFLYIRPITRGDRPITRSDRPITRSDRPITREERLPCVICLTFERRIAFTTCGHLCICRNCSNNSSVTSCPICRNLETGRIEIFDP